MKKKLKNFFLSVAVLVLLLILSGLVCFKLAVTDVNDGVFTAEPSNELPMAILKSSISTGEATVTEQQLNSYAAYTLSGIYGMIDSEQYWVISDAYIDINGENSSRCYLRLKRGSFVLSLACDIGVEMTGGEIIVRFSNASVGKLPLPQPALKLLMKQICGSVSTSSNYIHPDEAALHLPTHYGINIEGLGELAAIDITTLKLGSDEITAAVTPNVDSSIQGLFDSFSGVLGGALDDLLSRGADLFGYFSGG